MKAIVHYNYGSPDVLQLEEVEKPTPKDNEVLVRVHAASLNAGDRHALRGTPFLIRLMNGLLRPRNKILGDDIAGRVEAVGRSVKQFQPGDEVFGISDFGAFAEYACADEKYLALKPASMTFEEAAAVPMAAFPALQGLRDQGQIQSGQKVLIHGASGGVGTFAVQIAKSFGAEVTGVCSKRKSDMVRSIGADHVIDYTGEDFTRSGQGYDLILAVGGDRSIFDYKRALGPEGIYVCVGGSMAQYFQAILLGPLISMVGSKKMGVVMPRPNQRDFAFLIELHYLCTLPTELAGMALSMDNRMNQHTIVQEENHAQAHDMPFRGFAQVPGVVPPLFQSTPVEVLRDRTAGPDRI